MVFQCCNNVMIKMICGTHRFFLLSIKRTMFNSLCFIERMHFDGTFVIHKFDKTSV